MLSCRWSDLESSARVRGREERFINLSSEELGHYPSLRIERQRCDENQVAGHDDLSAGVVERNHRF
jgi:hypothetical protein